MEDLGDHGSRDAKDGGGVGLVGRGWVVVVPEVSHGDGRIAKKPKKRGIHFTSNF